MKGSTRMADREERGVAKLSSRSSVSAKNFEHAWNDKNVLVYLIHCCMNQFTAPWVSLQVHQSWFLWWSPGREDWQCARRLTSASLCVSKNPIQDSCYRQRSRQLHSSTVQSSSFTFFTPVNFSSCLSSYDRPEFQPPRWALPPCRHVTMTNHVTVDMQSKF